MSLKAVYEAELQRRRDEELARDAARLDGVQRLQAFYEGILADGLPEPNTEIEFADDELMVDPGLIMITVRVTPEGKFRLFYEVKSPDAYNEIEVPGIEDVADLEREIAKLLVDYRLPTLAAPTA